MVCTRADFLAVTGNAELRSIPGYPALARRFAGAGRAVHARLGRGAVESHPRTDVGRRRVDERARNLMAGLRTMPALRAAGIVVWCVGLLTAAFELAVAPDGRILGAALYLACVGQLAILLRRLGNYGPTAVLYPVPLLAFGGALVWSLVRPRATPMR
jgi:hypothetical protein